tara:strand:- start:232 stop:1194 length:963 start_codon:yes stop_codon:yes gene_type:complete
LEVQILLYYLKVFSIIIIIIFLIFFINIYSSTNKKLLLDNEYLVVPKGENISNIINTKIKNLNFLEIFIFKFYHKLNTYLFNKQLHYGDFYLGKNITFHKFLEILYEPSNILNKITIVEGWSKKELEDELSKHFTDIKEIPYNDILADTYFYEKNENINFFLNKLKKYKINYFEKFKENILNENYNNEEIMIIGSLIEREGLDYYDKKNISSVIFNRLKINMRLQIDASVLFAITDGEYNLNRTLNLRDLKFKHPFNTYVNNGLPPKPIAYVGTKTIDLIYENYKSDFLFYFFDNSLKKHIFSNDFENHKKRLNEYRNQK